jgi:hypothetical protein
MKKVGVLTEEVGRYYSSSQHGLIFQVEGVARSGV